MQGRVYTGAFLSGAIDQCLGSGLGTHECSIKGSEDGGCVGNGVSQEGTYSQG